MPVLRREDSLLPEWGFRVFEKAHSEAGKGIGRNAAECRTESGSPCRAGRTSHVRG